MLPCLQTCWWSLGSESYANLSLICQIEQVKCPILFQSSVLSMTLRLLRQDAKLDPSPSGEQPNALKCRSDPLMSIRGAHLLPLGRSLHQIPNSAQSSGKGTSPEEPVDLTTVHGEMATPTYYISIDLLRETCKGWSYTSPEKQRFSFLTSMSFNFYCLCNMEAEKQRLLLNKMIIHRLHALLSQRWARLWTIVGAKRTFIATIGVPKAVSANSLQGKLSDKWIPLHGNSWLICRSPKKPSAIWRSERAWAEEVDSSRLSSESKGEGSSGWAGYSTSRRDLIYSRFMVAK